MSPLAPPLLSPLRSPAPAKAGLTTQLVGFDARILVNEITEQAREVLTSHVNGIEAWAMEMARRTKDPRVEREVKIVRAPTPPSPTFTDQQGMHAFETLLESHVDKAFDKFAAWALRNAFEVPSDAQVVLVRPFLPSRCVARCLAAHTRPQLPLTPEAMAQRPRLCPRRAHHRQPRRARRARCDAGRPARAGRARPAALCPSRAGRGARRPAAGHCAAA